MLKASSPALSAELRGGMSDLATVHQSTTRCTEPGSIEASAQAQNFGRRFGVLALGVGHEGPAAADRHILAAGRDRQLEDAVGDVGRVVAHRRNAPDADILDGAIARAEIGDHVAAATAEHLPRRGAGVDRVLPELQRLRPCRAS